jgi:hypothetical protein
MKIKSSISILLVFQLLSFLIFNSALAQGELNATVNLDYSQVQATAQDKAFIEEIKQAMTNFLNNRKWTADEYKPEERIRCNFSINITAITGVGSYVATAQVQSSRPVYGTAYESTLLNFFDKDFNFSYQQGQPMDFNENIYLNEITTLLGFYANVIIGMDYDSFSKLGGSSYFEKVRIIASNVPSQPGGWEPLSKSNTNNRATLAENLQSQQFLPVRQDLYIYHRIILDDFLNQKKPEEGYAQIIQLLKDIKLFDTQKRPYMSASRNFFFAKGGELLNIMAKAPTDIKKQVVDICSEVDPTNSQKYEKLMTMN